MGVDSSDEIDIRIAKASQAFGALSESTFRNKLFAFGCFCTFNTPVISESHMWWWFQVRVCTPLTQQKWDVYVEYGGQNLTSTRFAATKLIHIIEMGVYVGNNGQI